MKTQALIGKIENEIRQQIDTIISLRNKRIQKEDLSFVTEGDLLVNRIIHELANKELPNVIIISEENKNSPVEDLSGYIIVVDPIDGTENFTSGLPEWGVSVSCYFNGVHECSLLGCPEMNLWVKTGDTVPASFSRIAGLSSSLSKEDLLKATQGYEYRIMGCCVYNMINVVRGGFHSFENPKGAQTWDILGGLNLAIEHNLEVIVNDEKYKGQYLPADRKYRFRISR